MIGLVYLAWAPLGPAPLREFLRSYHDHPAGVEHQLIVVLNGADRSEPGNADSDSGGEALSTALLAELGKIEHRLIELERPVLDLPAYGLAARHLEHERVCFLNSYSTILADGWLGQLSHALDDANVGVAGATGSWESQAEWVRGKPVYWPYQLAMLPRARRDYPRFPNPHLRTTAFMLDRMLLLEAGFEQAADKRDTYLLESGPHSFTRQILQRGLRPIVVGRDDRAYDIDEWPASATYRAEGQRNLLVADNRTRDWERASPRLRRRLSRDAWGSRASRGGPRTSLAADKSRWPQATSTPWND
jgi:hypothetical protein